MNNLPYEVRNNKGKIISRHFSEEIAVEEATEYSKEDDNVYCVTTYWKYKRTIEILRIIYRGQVVEITGG